MAEEQQKSSAQSKLGELFVEFGSSGLGKFLKGLNGVKAQFLLSKAAAEQFTKPLINMSKNAAGGITALDKLNSVTGLSIRQLQELKVWTQLNNIGFGEMMGQIEGLQRNLFEVAMGQGNVKGFTLLGLDPRQMDYRKPMEALAKIRERVQQLDEATGALALKELGLSQDLLYAFKQQNNAFDQRLLLNKQEEESLKNQQSAWNSLSATWTAAQDKFIAKQSWIVNLIENTRKVIEFAGNATKEDYYELFNKSVKEGVKWNINDLSNPKESKTLRAMIEPTALGMGYKTGKLLADYIQYTFGNEKTPNAVVNNTQHGIVNPPQKLESPFKLETIPDAELGADNAIEEKLTAAPSIASAGGNNINIQVQVNQDINGDNAIEIASRARDGIEDSLNTLILQNGVLT